jgi:uncharacterized repeat protein (TIGR01451 family)
MIMNRGAGINFPRVVPAIALLLMLFLLSASGDQPSPDGVSKGSCMGCDLGSNMSAESASISTQLPGGAESAISDQSALRPAGITFNLLKGTPSANSERIITGNDTAKSIQLRANDFSNDKLRYEIIRQPKHGKIRGTGPVIVYLPDKGYSGNDSFTFSASDGMGTNRVVTVPIEVVSLYHPPHIIISSPLNGMIFTEDPKTHTASVTISTDVSENVVSVTFYDNMDEVGTVSAAPFMLTYNTYQGPHTLTAVATDSFGATCSSLPVVIMVNPPEPHVKITSPANGQIFTAPADIPIIAKAYCCNFSDNCCPDNLYPDNRCPDNCCPLSVGFFADSQFLGVVKAPPYQLDWTNVLPGIYHLIAKAVDGNSAISETALTVVVPVNPLSASNLALTMSSQPTSVRIGANFNYVLTVSNFGPDNATDVNVTDFLPAEVKYVSSKASQGNYDSSSGVWDVGGLYKYHSARLVITSNVPDNASPGQIFNKADAAGAETDPDDSNNHASAMTNIGS